MERAHRMDTILKKIEDVASLATLEPAPAPLDASRVMARIQGMSPEIEDDGDTALSLKLFAGVGVAAAVAAALIFVFAAGAWMDLGNNNVAMESLLEVLEVSL